MTLPWTKSSPRVSIIVPAFNEEGNLDELCRHFAEMGGSADFTYEVVIIDDGSTDSSADKLTRLKKEFSFLRVARHKCNRGLTDALKTGFAKARGDIFVFYPSDLQYLPEDIPRMIAKLDEGNDLVTGWKQGNYDKRFISKIYNGLSRWLFNLKVHDLNSVKAFRREVAENIFLRQDWHRYMVPLAVEKGFRVDEVKIPLYERHSGESKFSGKWRIMIGFLDLLAVKTQISLLRKPLLFFGLIGLVFISSGMVIGLVAIYLRFILDIGLRPLLYLVILFLVLGGLSFILGFLGEGMTAIREEVSGLRSSLAKLELTRKSQSDSDD